MKTMMITLHSGSLLAIISHLWIGVLFWSISPTLAAPSGAPDESEANSVSIQFYLLKQSKVNYQQCGLKTWADKYKFSSGEVSIIKVEALKTSLNVTYLVNFNSYVVNNTSSVVKKAALVESIRESRTDINDVINYDILSAGENTYSPEPDYELNRIIIPVAGGILLLLVLITVILFYWSKNRDLKEKRELNKELRKSKRQKRSKKQASSDSVSISGTRSVTRVAPTPGGDTNRERRQANGHHKPPAHSFHGQSVVDNQQKQTTRSSTFTFNAAASLTTSRDDEESYPGNQTEDTILNTTDPGHRNTSLPPLDDSVNNDRKKAKKHKKHRNDRKSDDHNDRFYHHQTDGNMESDVDQRRSHDPDHQGQYIPPAAEYRKRYYDDEYLSDTGNKLSPV
ncbi:hypothetical protein LSH36_267g00011 [Paralvinella palmiformis]|uniref:Uncharacterized protein n=1 Tax=Paralvinella palmiformis TaxID=53620 RepID=A0AAD9JKP5_9ANNE|nr:hypothetical protein LSH36_267g00011 [Paralvinella palmiformis]